MTPRPLEEVVKDVLDWDDRIPGQIPHYLSSELRASLAEREKEKVKSLEGFE